MVYEVYMVYLVYMEDVVYEVYMYGVWSVHVWCMIPEVYWFDVHWELHVHQVNEAYIVYSEFQVNECAWGVDGVNDVWGVRSVSSIGAHMMVYEDYMYERVHCVQGVHGVRKCLKVYMVYEVYK